ncbi:uncharacterized protein PRCAT00005930001 [Priceomyces carsonii]|uniref:uncharacterized protein n=1 Tax=Priceomyces carsonii TaxID=28549 RepID=UPI002EDAB8C5|nr:unnamed protein product [Priceomyces carsonii]
MDIPLKSQREISLTGLAGKTAESFSNSMERHNVPRVSSTIDLGNYESHSNPCKLTRVYSESEKSNFDAETGHRLYDDGKIRPQLSRSNSHLDGDDSSAMYDIRSQSHKELPNFNAIGLEDEYIPDLNFKHLIYKWNKPSDQNLLKYYDRNDHIPSTSTSGTNTPVMNSSYLDLNTLHSKVAPQPINPKGYSPPKYTYSKLNDVMKMRSRYGGESLSRQLSTDYEKKNKKIKSAVNPETGTVDYEAILDSLPSNFNDLPYSQRKKLVTSFADSADYSEFSLFAKQYFSDKASSSSSKTPKSGNGSFRRPRRDSSNTVAGRLLAISSSTDLHKSGSETPKINVDEKGAYVMDHELGKVIGFGAWGTIRECTSSDGSIRAIKIVKSYKENDSYTSKDSQAVSRNPKVLEVFKQEISIWKLLHHSNILPLIQYLETERAIFCITNKIHGGTLFEIVSQWGYYIGSTLGDESSFQFQIGIQRSRLMQSVSYLKQIISALLYLHQEKGIVHGDLKLENVLVDDSNKEHYKMVLCDFGMSRIYTSRLSRKSSRLGEEIDNIRSRSSAADMRKPYYGNTASTRHLFSDDSKIGISNYLKPHGPSLQSVDLTPSQSNISLHRFNDTLIDTSYLGIDSELPHSHIGSLPYASPELLLPSPPPLGPSADIWALGILMYTMIVGKLPFQHQYEPRLRAMISAGRYDKEDLKKATLIQCVYGDVNKELTQLADSFSLSENITKLKNEWLSCNSNEYKWVYDVIVGCLETDITKRLDIESINNTFSLKDI